MGQRSCITIPKGNVICCGTGGGLTAVANIGAGDGNVFSSISGGDTINLRTLYGSGDTTVTTSGDTIIINSSGGGGSGSGVTTGTNIGVGNGCVYSSINGDNINLRTLYGSGDTTVTTSGDTIIINSSGGGGSTSPGGSNGQIQYNDNSSFNGSLFEYDDSTCRFGIYATPSASTLISICEPSDLSYDSGYDYIRTYTTDGISNFAITIGDIGGNGASILEVSSILNSRDNFNQVCPLVISSCCSINIAATSGVSISCVINFCSLVSLPPSPSVGDMVRLSGHASCSDGIWVYNGTSWQSITIW